METGPSLNVSEISRHLGADPPCSRRRRRSMLAVFQTMSRRGAAAVNDDVLYRFRLRLFGLAQDLGNVRAACRTMGVHPSTYCRWREHVLRSGLEMLRPRERRPPRVPNQLSQLIETRIVAFSLGHPGLDPRRIAATLAQERWGGLSVSPNGAWRVLPRHGLNRRISRLSLVAGYGALPEPEGAAEPEPRHLEVDHQASWWASTVSTWAGYLGRAAESGSTPPSIWPRATSGPSCTSARSTHRPGGPRPWPGESPPIWQPTAGASNVS
jgi:hypothetical protein